MEMHFQRALHHHIRLWGMSNAIYVLVLITRRMKPPNCNSGPNCGWPWATLRHHLYQPHAHAFSIAHQRLQLTTNDVLDQHHRWHTRQTAVVRRAVETSLLEERGLKHWLLFLFRGLVIAGAYARVGGDYSVDHELENLNYLEALH